MVIERTPKIVEEELFKALLSPQDSQIEEIVEKVNGSYDYWDTVKYKKMPCRIYSYTTVGPCQGRPTKKLDDSMEELRSEFESDKHDAENVS